MLKVLVTGRDGQLGQCIKSVAHQYPNLEFDFKASSELDITNKAKVESFFNNQQYDYCINCAAYTNVDQAEAETELAHIINVLGPKYLSESCSKHQVTLIHISTDFVFDGNASNPYKETDSTNPIGVYGKTKLEGEQEIIEKLNNYFIIRTSWLYSEFGNNFLKTMQRLASERDEIGVVGDQIGSPTYAIDLANIVLGLIQDRNTSYGIYHYSNEGVISWYDFAKEIFRLSKSTIKINKIETKDYPTKAKRPKYSVLDTSKIKHFTYISNWKDSLFKAILNINN
ncbi:dTDP-4-dehydrorhamnose reductase [Winogradskyella litoriviva]|uniref:dTDP-4-dehydrorhamnose reductase n=1 Tax=Winogradskyella litoriviva TaxID=1220182 RepID=A0ABX2E1J7_9FLAO|nr:dTDP-4-dehydrorhamnose reductase [Winogradskyella litoriviva]NRD22165.1 dTDP-4-dehydrorhamnose reductase [Winogradskyella litoriviva]